MKKIMYLIVFVFLGISGLFSQDLWRFEEGEKTLYYNKEPFTPYQGVWTPLGYFVFTPFGVNPFHYYGWQKVKDAPAIPSAVAQAREHELKRGWFFASGQPANVRLGEWLFFPATSLWARPESFLKLYRQWQVFYEHYPPLSTAIYNQVEPDIFYRFVTPYLTKDVIKVEAQLPAGWIEVYSRRLEKNGPRQLFLFYFPRVLSFKSVEWIKIRYRYQKGRSREELLKLIYQKDTGLGIRGE